MEGTIPLSEIVGSKCINLHETGLFKIDISFILIEKKTGFIKNNVS